MTGVDQAIVDIVLNGEWHDSEIDQRTKSALRLVEAMTLTPESITSSLVSELQSNGLSVAEIEEVASVAFQFQFINRVADAMDFPMPDDEQQGRQTKMLNFLGRFVFTKPPQPNWIKGKDGIVRPTELERGRNLLLGRAGSLSADVRRDVESYAASLWHATRPEANLTDSVEAFVRPLSLHAYRIHDELITRLLDDGYTEQQIFELTLVGSVGAAMAGQERLFEALSSTKEPAAV